LQKISDVYVNIDNRGSFGSKSLGQETASLDNLCSGIRRGGSSHNAILEINQDESGFLPFEM
jgi:hypothetical protein